MVAGLLAVSNMKVVSVDEPIAGKAVMVVVSGWAVGLASDGVAGAGVAWASGSDEMGENAAGPPNEGTSAEGFSVEETKPAATV